MSNMYANGLQLGDIMYITDNPTEIPGLIEIPYYFNGNTTLYILPYPTTYPTYACNTSPTNYLLNGQDICFLCSPVFFKWNSYNASWAQSYNLNIQMTQIYFVIIGAGGYGGNGGQDNGGSGGGGGSIWGYFDLSGGNDGNLILNVNYNSYAGRNNNITLSVVNSLTTINTSAFATSGDGGSSGGVGSGGYYGINTPPGSGIVLNYTGANGSNGSLSSPYNPPPSGYNSWCPSNGYASGINYPWSPNPNQSYGNGGPGSGHGGQGSPGQQAALQIWFIY
jgi:hypothetical protein